MSVSDARIRTKGTIMATYTEEITLSDVVVGDRWVGISSITATINGSTPGLALDRVRLSFRLGQSVYTLDSDEAEITIDADAWTASVPAQDTFLNRAGLWSWNMEFWPTGYASPFTLYSGTLRVWDDVD